ncbi:Topoisomerase IV subunit A [Klebsiella pneumoniae]|nr:Topoisomerase IV subunit A [Klebsiella pneumoniae]
MPMPSATTVARRFHEREEAKAMSEHDMLPSEPVTIVLSQMGWVRSAKDTTLTPRA